MVVTSWHLAVVILRNIYLCEENSKLEVGQMSLRTNIGGLAP